MSKHQPLVSILLPAYNAEKFITDALLSITNQTYTNLEIIVINDGSTDGTTDKVNAIKDKRIKLIHNEKNLGLIGTLNKGIDLCSGKYIARMDADDVSIEDRIELQVIKMEENSDLGICGTWFETHNTEKLLSVSKYSPENDRIQVQQLYQIHLCHGTAIFKKEVLEKHKFDANYAHAEDFELWSRIKNDYTMANIPKVLYKVNTHGDNVSILNNDTQNKNTVRVISKQLEYLSGNHVPEDTAILYRKLCEADFCVNLTEIEKIGVIISEITLGDSKLHLQNPNYLKEYLSEKWEHMCYHNLKEDKSIYGIWKQFSPMKASTKTTLKFHIKRFI